MRPISLDEIKDLATYERVRPELRRQIVELRNLRCLTVGKKISVVFENRETVLFQIQETLRAERIIDEPAILHEIEACNELLPRPGHLAGSLFVELSDPERIREELEELAGLDRGEHLWFELGAEGRVLARFAEGQSKEGRITSVHFVQFPFPREAANAFRALTHPVHLVLDHPNHRARVAVEGATRRCLAEDLGVD